MYVTHCYLQEVSPVPSQCIVVLNPRHLPFSLCGVWLNIAINALLVRVADISPGREKSRLAP